MKQPQEFNKSDVERKLIYELNTFRAIKDAFVYVHAMLVSQGHSYDLGAQSTPDFQTLNWSEGKNYNWLALSIGDVGGSTEFLIRQYGRHLTVFTKLTDHLTHADLSYTEKTYGCFTFNTNRDKMNSTRREEYDFIENPFHDFQLAFPDILRLVNENKLHSLWNDRDLPRPSYIDVKTAFYGEQIQSIDLLVFGAEELTQKHLELYAENDMLDILKKLKEVDVIGELFEGQSIIKSVVTDFPPQYCDPYYHGVGIATIDAKDKQSFHDVYTLTRYYFKNIELLMSK